MPDLPQLIDQQLLAAYRSTTYRVAAQGTTLALHIDQHNADLAKLLQDTGVDCAALLTAWNPGSNWLSRTDNALRQRALLDELAAGGFCWLPAANVPHHGSSIGEDWTEDSVLVLALDRHGANAIAARYGQCAFLWMDRSATPQLIVTGAHGPTGAPASGAGFLGPGGEGAP